MTWYSQITLAQADPKPAGDQPAPTTEGGATGTESQSLAPTGGGTQTTRSPGTEILWMVGLFILLMWVLILLPQKREKKKHAAMMSALQKGDRVQTIGGILGTIVEVRDREIILKVDEASNTRLRFTRAAIQGVVEEPKE